MLVISQLSSTPHISSFGISNFENNDLPAKYGVKS